MSGSGAPTVPVFFSPDQQYLHLRTNTFVPMFFSKKSSKNFVFVALMLTAVLIHLTSVVKLLHVFD